MNEKYKDKNGFLWFYNPKKDKGSKNKPPEDEGLITCDRIIANYNKDILKEWFMDTGVENV